MLMVNVRYGVAVDHVKKSELIRYKLAVSLHDKTTTMQLVKFEII